MAEEVRRVEHVREIASAFWPGAVQNGASGDATEEVLVLPFRGSPRCLVPTDPRLAVSALTHLFPDASPRGRLALRGLAALLRVPLASRLFRTRLGGQGGESIATVLDELTGSQLWAMRVSRARANRKPVLVSLDESGTPVAWVKVGMNPLTERLVRDEAAALSVLGARLPCAVQVPTVLGIRQWHGLQLMALAPLPTRGASRPSRDEVVAAVRAIAEAEGTSTCQLRRSAYWSSLGDRLRARSDPRSQRLSQVWQHMDAIQAGAELEFGGSHGDWVPWNFGAGPAGVLVWDLERYRRGVPVGLDLVHLDLQTHVLGTDVDVPAEVARRVAPISNALRQVGVEAGNERLVIQIYLLDIADRWIADGQDGVSTWSVVLDGMVAAADDIGRGPRQGQEQVGERA